jgi:flagellar biosynthesis/type III secretory pathway chaperone
MSSDEKSVRLDKLRELQQILIHEREAAKVLNIQGLDQATQAKEELLGELQNERLPLSPEEESLVRQVQYELRRNATFFDQALGWVRESVQVIRGDGQQSAYSPAGDMRGASQEGRLISGRI